MELVCQQISKTYQTRSGSICALEDVTFNVCEQEFVCIVGPSGCGKTTLLKIVAGLLPPTSGQIIFNAEQVNGRNRSAMVFQEHGLYPWMSVLDNVAFGLEMRGVPRQARQEQARAFIEKVGMASFAENYPHELSVGMQQRIGIARAFVTNPQILLMDEPFGSLDAQTRLVLQEELLFIWKEHPKLVLFITHDIEEAVLLGDRVFVMTGHPGRIREEILIPLARPRDLSDRFSPEMVRIKRRIWNLLEDEARGSLQRTT